MDLSGKTVVFIGRLGHGPRREAAHLVELNGGVCRRAVTRQTDIVIVGHGAHTLINDGRLDQRLAQAEALGAVCWSENRLLAALGVVPPGNRRHIDRAVRELVALSRLDARLLRLLILFDIVNAGGSGTELQDVASARRASDLLQQGLSFGEIVAGMLKIRERERPGGPRIAHLAANGSNLAIRWQNTLSELDGQLRLPLSEAATPSVDELFEAAEWALDNGDAKEAERLYRLCARRDPSDPTASFNLANVLRDRGAVVEAKVLFQQVTALDPRFSEAWYNLAHILEAQGRRREARVCLTRAVEVDPDFADAQYNLGLACYEAGDYDAAARSWQAYLVLDSESAWSRKARRGITLCRQKAALTKPR